MPTEIKQANMLKEIISNRKLIWDLSKNDFKTRFAGSYLGIIWAFVQPIVTVLVYLKKECMQAVLISDQELQHLLFCG
mgnify:CR=1 FL=1